MTSTPALRRLGPAERLLETLPLGNGRLGALAWGDPARARFSLHESTLWSGAPEVDAPHRTPRREAAAAMTRSRALFEHGTVPEAEAEIERLGGSWPQAPLPVGELTVRLEVAPAGEAPVGRAFDGGTLDGGVLVGGPLVGRVLDLAVSEHRVLAAGGEHLSFVSAADEVLVHAAPCPDGARVVLDLDSPLVEQRREAGADGLTVVLAAPSDVPAGRSRRAQAGAGRTDGASRAAVVVRTRREAGRLLLACAVVTTWQGLGKAPDRDVEDVLAQATAQAEAALARGEEELRRRHRAHLPPGAGEVALTLDGSADAEPLATAFASGRYLLAAASRPGLPPLGLAGPRAAPQEAPGSSYRTPTLALAMSHWAAGAAHVPHAAEALEQLVAMLRAAGRETARRLYGADGWTAHHHTDPWGFTEPARGDASGADWPLGGLWLERELDSLADFRGQDAVELARERFPALREAVAFTLCLLHESADGHLATYPSTSPEDLWRTAEGTAVSLSEGTGTDRWLLRETTRRLVDAAALLGRTQDPVVQRAASTLDLVPGPRIGADGRIVAWHRDGLPEAEPHHRQLSPLGFLYPGGTPASPCQEQAAARSLEVCGDETSGWSLVWTACLWARLRRPDRVQALLEQFLRPPGIADEASPLEGTVGIVAVLAECLLQSHRGEIELLPALPAMTADGSVRGLRARPGVSVDMTWSEGALTALSLRAVGPGAHGTHRVRCGERTLPVELSGLEPVEVNVTALTEAPASPRSPALTGLAR